MKIEDLTPEQVEQAEACKTYEEFMAFAEEASLEFDEDQTKALRLLYNDPEKFAAYVEQACADTEDADITADDLKAIAGGVSGDRAMQIYWPIIVHLSSPSRMRGIIMDIHNKYMVMN